MKMVWVPLKASSPPLPPHGDWWSSTPLDRLTSLPVAQQLFSPLAARAAGVGVHVFVRLAIFLCLPLLTLFIISPSPCFLLLLRLSTDTPLPCSTCLACPLQKSDMFTYI